MTTLLIKGNGCCYNFRALQAVDWEVEVPGKQISECPGATGDRTDTLRVQAGVWVLKGRGYHRQTLQK